MYSRLNALPSLTPHLQAIKNCTDLSKISSSHSLTNNVDVPMSDDWDIGGRISDDWDIEGAFHPMDESEYGPQLNVVLGIEGLAEIAKQNPTFNPPDQPA